jgi:serine/threonine protein kinase
MVALLSKALKKAWSLDGREHFFLPIGKVEHIITKEAVFRELCEQLGNAGRMDEELVNQLKEADLEKLAGKICHDEPLEENPLKYQSFRRTFATLVFAGKTLAIKQFIDDNISDLDLPLAAAGDSSYEDFVNLRRRNNKDVRLSCFNGWQLNEMERFAKCQWRVTAPYFSRDEFNRVRHFSLFSEHIMPFINSPEERNNRLGNSTEGGTSQVYMIDIHPEHHGFDQADSGLEGRVAIKEIKQQENEDKQLFQIEARALRRFKHKHVVTLLATYEQFNRYYLMFPRAEADLFGFWKDERPDRSHNGMVWLAKQCEGMADALERLHKATFMDRSSTFPVDDIPKNPARLRKQRSYASTGAIAPRASDKGAAGSKGLAADDDGTMPQYRLTRRASTSDCRFMRQEWTPQRCGCYSEEPDTSVGVRPNANHPPAANKVWGRHGDIKPQNILWYRDSRNCSSLGTLKLADFGQAELNSQWSRSKHRIDLAHSTTYRAPEFDIPPYITHASYDIWSLGCVYLEFVVWVMGGYNAVDKFNKSRISLERLIPVKTDVFFETTKKNGREEAKLKPSVKNVSLALLVFQSVD